MTRSWNISVSLLHGIVLALLITVFVLLPSGAQRVAAHDTGHSTASQTAAFSALAANSSAYVVQFTASPDLVDLFEVSPSEGSMEYHSPSGMYSTIDVLWIERVRATNAGGSSGYTQGSASTGDLEAPTNVALTDRTAVNLTYDWDDVAGATVYEYQHRESDDAWPETSIMVTDSTVMVTGLSPNTEYDFQVAARDMSSTSAFSDVLTEYTLLPTPQNLSATATSPTAVTLDWDDVAGATNYEYQHREGSNGTWSSATTISASTVAVSSLAAGTEHHFQVRARSANNESAWAGSAVVTTNLTTPTGLYVKNRTETTATLAWDAVTRATTYQIRWREKGNADWTLRNVVDGTEDSITQLTTGLIYEAQVLASNSASSSDWSGNLEFGTELDAPQNVRLIDRALTSISWAWNAVDGAERYYWQSRLEGTTDWGSETTYVATNQVEVTGLLVNSTYEFRVRAWSQTRDYSAYSTVRTGTTRRPPPFSRSAGYDFDAEDLLNAVADNTRSNETFYDGFRDGNTYWAVWRDTYHSSNYMVSAYDYRNGAVKAGQTFELHENQRNPRGGGIIVDNGYIYVANQSYTNRWVYAYNQDSKAYSASESFELDTYPTGMAVDDDYIWVLSSSISSASKTSSFTLDGYDKSTKARVPSTRWQRDNISWPSCKTIGYIARGYYYMDVWRTPGGETWFATRAYCRRYLSGGRYGYVNNAFVERYNSSGNSISWDNDFNPPWTSGRITVSYPISIDIDGDDINVAGRTTSVHAYTYGDVAKQNYNLDPRNDTPAGIYSDGATVWIADKNSDRAFAYNASTKQYDESKSLVFRPGIEPTGIWSDGTTMWVASDEYNRIYGHLHSTSRQIATDDDTDIDTDDGIKLNDNAALGAPGDMWGNDVTLWVVDTVTSSNETTRIYAYDTVAHGRIAAEDISQAELTAHGIEKARGIWSNGATLWISDEDDDKIYALFLNDKTRSATEDFDTLRAASNNDPFYLAGNDVSMWVAGDPDGDKAFFSYSMPFSKAPAFFTAVVPILEHTVNLPTKRIIVRWDSIVDANGYDVVIDNSLPVTMLDAEIGAVQTYSYTVPGGTELSTVAVRARVCAEDDAALTVELDDGTMAVVPSGQCSYSPYSETLVVRLASVADIERTLPIGVSEAIGADDRIALGVGELLELGGAIDDAENYSTRTWLPPIIFFGSLVVAGALIWGTSKDGAISPGGVFVGSFAFAILFGIAGPLKFNVPVYMAAASYFIPIVSGVFILKTRTQ